MVLMRRRVTLAKNPNANPSHPPKSSVTPWWQCEWYLGSFRLFELAGKLQLSVVEKSGAGQSNTSVSVVDSKSSQIVFAHSAGKGWTNQLQKTAEDCAKQLKDFIEKSQKSRKE